MADDVRLSIRDLDKSFAAPVLKRVSLSIAAGEVHALVGENGAGKSTLVKILAGLLRKDAGRLLLDGEAYEPRSARDGIRAGVSLATQELSIVEPLTVAENIALRDFPQRGFAIARQQLRREASRLLREVGLAGVDPNVPGEALSLGQRQLVELARAIRSHCRLLILDEPTSALTAPQATRVHNIVRKLAGSGVSVIYISHRLNDVLDVANRVTVLRDGEIVLTAPAAQVSVSNLVEKMAGRDIGAVASSSAAAKDGAPLFEARNLSTTELPNPIDLCCRQGEILGIAGLAGSGKSELLQALFGLVPPTGGRVIRHIGNRETTLRSAPHAVNLGVGFLGEDRQATGVFPGLSLIENMMVSGARAGSLFRSIDRGEERKSASDLTQRMEVRCEGVEQDIGQLSGGNQQKVLIARWLRCESDVLLLDEPTRGVDVGTKHIIYQLLLGLQSEHKAIIVASSEIDELMAICSRILVLSNRKLVKEFSRGTWSETDILAAAFHEYSSQPRAADAERTGGHAR